MIDRAGLADFLRRRRELLRPADVGLPQGARRRTPGLRRDEVAALAGISSDYYARLEQSRGANPSEPVVRCLARALQCDRDQRDHLYHLAGLTPPTSRAGSRLSPGLVGLADRLVDVPVLICTDLDEVLWQNRLAEVVLGVPGSAGPASNITWLWFTRPQSRAVFPQEDWPRHSAAHVADLRATSARRAGDSDVAALVADLRAHSQEFRELWERHEVAVHRYDRKRVLHPEVGLLDLTCEVLLTPEDDIRLRIFLPAQGTDASEKLDLLRVIGTQTFPSDTAVGSHGHGGAA